MCKWSKWGDTRIDPCMREIVKFLKEKHTIVACCCGHSRYPMTIVVKEGVTDGLKRTILFTEIFSGIVFEPRKKIYKRDEQGYYYIPEVQNAKR